MPRNPTGNSSFEAEFRKTRLPSESVILYFPPRGVMILFHVGAANFWSFGAVYTICPSAVLWIVTPWIFAIALLAEVLRFISLPSAVCKVA
ncbi:hypothetical protein D3C87_1510490 [compost metagenome]